MIPESFIRAERAIARLNRDNENQIRLQQEANRRNAARVEEASEIVLTIDDVRTDIRVGMIAEDCALHIGEVIKCDILNDEVIIKSMFDGVERRCSLYNCGVVAQTAEEIELKKRLYAEGGMKSLSDYYHSQCDKLLNP